MQHGVVDPAKNPDDVDAVQPFDAEEAKVEIENRDMDWRPSGHPILSPELRCVRHVGVWLFLRLLFFFSCHHDVPCWQFCAVFAMRVPC